MMRKQYTSAFKAKVVRELLREEETLAQIAAERALSRATPVIWNSDQGNHFTSSQSIELLKAHQVQISMDSKGRALDNVFTGRLWRTVKYAEVYVHEYSSPKEARSQLSNFFEFYNQKRLHQSLDYRTPAEVYAMEQTIRE